MLSPPPVNHPIYLTPHSRAIGGRPSLFASLVLGLTLNVSMVSVMGSKLGAFSSSVGHALSALALVFLVILTWFRKHRFTFNSLPQSLKLSLITLGITTALLGFYGLSSPNIQSNLRLSIVMKSGGVLISLFALSSSARIFSFKEIVNALYVFSIVELAGCFLIFYTGGDVNENAIAVRVTVACMCLYTLLPKQWMSIMAIFGCLVFSTKLGCRTSSVALLSSVLFLSIEKRSRKQRGLVLVIAFSGLTLLLVFLPLLASALQELAIASLGSENPIAKFFLHDKSSAKISHDYLDRYEVWSFAWEHIRHHLILGHGLGTEHAIMQIRSHNAYMSLLFEGGFTLLLAWLWFYLRSVVALFDRRFIATVGESKLFHLASILMVYMLLAGVVESSGLSSVSTPMNLIFILLTVWLCQPKREHNNRRFTGGR